MPKELLLDLLDDPTCQQLMKSDHVSRDDELSLMKSVRPLFCYDVEMPLVLSHDQRRWDSDRRRHQERHLEDSEIDRRRLSERRQRPLLSLESQRYWLH